MEVCIGSSVMLTSPHWWLPGRLILSAEHPAVPSGAKSHSLGATVLVHTFQLELNIIMAYYLYRYVA